MSTSMGTAISKGEDSYEVGRKVAAEAMKKASLGKVDLSIVFASSKYDYDLVVKGVREVTGKAPLIGCSSAGEFTETSVEKAGVACAVIGSDTHNFFTSMGRGLRSDEINTLKKAVEDLPSGVNDFPFRSSFVFIDGLAGKGEEATLAACSALGPAVKFSGGAAGDDLKFKETKVFRNDDVASDAVSLCLVASKIPLQIGVNHGHCPISGPLTVTKAKGNILYEVEGEPALSVWKRQTADRAKMVGIDVNNLEDATSIGSFLLRYNAGLSIGNNYKVRTPLSVNEDGSLNFACTIIEGSVIRIMESSEEAQISATKTAAELAMKSNRGVKLAGAIVFDCVCRGIILKEHFSDAVGEIKKVVGPIPLIGFETYGEIAMEIGQLSGFHNTTTVIVLIPE